jgi:hypothetical protein
MAIRKGRSGVADLLAEAAQLSAEAAKLAARGDVDSALRLESQAEVLRRQARRRARSVPVLPTPDPRRETGRNVTIAALNELGVPCSPKSVADYAIARFGKALDYRALASLRRDEFRAWSSPRTHRPVYVVPALEGRRFLAIRGKVALSEWSLERRLVGPWSERVDHLKATLNVASHYAWVVGHERAHASSFGELLWSYAVTIPGAIEGEQLDDERVRRAARAELEVLEPEDAAWRTKAAVRAKLLGDKEQLWGAEPPSVVGVG